MDEKETLENALKTRSQEVVYWKAAAERWTNHYDKAVAAARGYQQQANQLEGVHAAAIAKAVKLQAEVEALQMKVLDRDKKISELGAQPKFVVRPWSVKQAEVERYKQDIIALKEVLADTRRDIRDSEARAGALQDRVVELTGERDELKQAIAEHGWTQRERFSRAERDARLAAARVAELEKEKAAAWPETAMSLQQTRTRLSEVHVERSGFLRELNAAKKDITEFEGTINELKSELSQAQRNADYWKKASGEWKARRDGAVRQRDDAHIQRDEFVRKYVAATKKVVEYNARIKDLKSMWGQTLDSRLILIHAIEDFLAGAKKKVLKGALEESFIDGWEGNSTVVALSDVIDDMYKALCPRCKVSTHVTEKGGDYEHDDHGFCWASHLRKFVEERFGK